MSKLYLRPAVLEDSDMYLEWANDPVVRKNSIQTATIKKEDHERWFPKKLSSPDCLMFVMECEGTPVGQVRLDIEKEEAEISYTIAAPFRGKGYGKEIISLAAQKAADPVTTLTAVVKPDNLPSLKIFEGLGFTNAGLNESDGLVHFFKTI